MQIERMLVKISACDGLPSLIDELNESESGVLLNGVLPLLKHTEIVWHRL